MPEEEQTVVQRAAARYDAAPSMPKAVAIMSALVGAIMILTFMWAEVIYPTLHPVGVQADWSWKRNIIWLGVGLLLLVPQQLYALLHALIPFLGRGKDGT